MNNTGIKKIQLSAFRILTHSLKLLDLNDTDIRAIDQDFFNQFTQLEEVWLKINFDTVKIKLNFNNASLKRLWLLNDEVLHSPFAANATLSQPHSFESIVTHAHNNLKIVIRNFNRIDSVELVKEYKNLAAHFTWKGIQPTISILTGKNGVGKTTLIELINASLNKIRAGGGGSVKFVHTYFNSAMKTKREVSNASLNTSLYHSLRQKIHPKKDITDDELLAILKESVLDTTDLFSSLLYFDLLLLFIVSCDDDYKLDDLNRILSINSFKYKFNNEKVKQRILKASILPHPTLIFYF
jgi:hypothetical protein